MAYATRAPLAPLLIARAGLDEMPTMNDSAGPFTGEALSRNAAVAAFNHQRGVRGFDNRMGGDRARDHLRRARLHEDPPGHDGGQIEMRLPSAESRKSRCRGKHAVTRVTASGALLLLAALACAPGYCGTPRAKADAAEAQSAPAAADALPALLAYEARTPPDVKVVGAETREGVTVEDITFVGACGAPVAAYVVLPSQGRGPFPAVIFVHWYAPRHPNSNRTQFLEEARALARRGVVSLLVSTFWSDPARYRARRWQDDYQNTLGQARDLRRALDVLLSRPGVDASRVAYVGHDYGAMFGALVSGADERPKAYALIAGAARFPDWYLYGSATGVPAGEEMEGFRKRFAPLDPVNAVRRSQAAFFFQYGEEDRFTPRENFVELYLAAPSPKRLATYASGHAMDAEAVRRDRTEWLAERLNLAPPRAAPK